MTTTPVRFTDWYGFEWEICFDGYGRWYATHIPTRPSVAASVLAAAREQCWDVKSARAEFDEMMRHTARPFPCRLHDYNTPTPGGSPAPQERP